MATARELSAAIRKLDSQIAGLQGRERMLTEQIERLESARASVKAVYEDDRSFVSWIESYDVGGDWRGSRREEFEASKREAKSACDTYCQGVEEAIGNIESKIRQLDGERSGIGWQIFSTRCSASALRAARAVVPVG